MSANPTLTQHNPIFDALATHRGFVVYRLVPKAQGGTDKVPFNPATGANSNAQDQSTWLRPHEAEAWAAALGPEYGVGIVVYEGSRLFCIDIDGAVKDGKWSDLALALFARFPGAAMEISVSGTGGHIFGLYAGPAPLHKTKNIGLHIELYTKARFIALTGTGAIGSILTDHTQALHQVIAEYFQQTNDTSVSGEWTDGPLWHVPGTADDAELVRKMRASRSTSAMFNSRASVEQLWTADADALGKFFPAHAHGQAYDASSADQALANHVAWWTGGDCERTERIMRQSALLREKWDNRGEYLRATILDALAFVAKNPPADRNAPVASLPPTAARVAPPPPSEMPTGGHPDAPLTAARAFVRAIYYRSGLQEIYHWQSVFMVYADGCYIELSKDGLRARVYPFLEIGAAGKPFKPDHVNAMVDALKATVYLDEKTPVPCWLDAPTVALPDLLICKNGALDLVTRVMHQLTARLFATIRLPVDFDAAAPPPTEWLKFLASLWPDDQESIDTLQEIFGLMLTPVTNFQKIFLLKGPKRSGKGTILRTLAKLLGADNVAAPALSTIADQYGMQCLIGKLAALIGDARISVRSDKMPVVVERLLSISGEDSPNVPRKFLPDWTGRLPTRFFMSSNELPHLDDPSGAMASRFVILNLRESFIGREDLGLERKLTKELTSILNWSLEGRARLMARGRFVQPATAAKLVEQMSELSSTVARFVRECCAVGPGHKVLKAELFKAWQDWCAINGKRAGESSMFGRDLCAAYTDVEETRPRDPTTGKQLPMYAGIAITSPPGPVLSSGVSLGSVGFGPKSV
jgi:putative DNA primase/helicase